MDGKLCLSFSIEHTVLYYRYLQWISVDPEKDFLWSRQKAISQATIQKVPNHPSIQFPNSYPKQGLGNSGEFKYFNIANTILRELFNYQIVFFSRAHLVNNNG